jgi:hypothetical protein
MFFRLMLSIHNLFRWAVVLALIWALFQAYRGWLGKKTWTSTDRRAGMFLTIGFDIQFLLGLILSFMSPIIGTAFSNLGAAMKVTELRFFAVEHMPMMFLALVIAHITSAVSRKAPDDVRKHRRTALGYTLVAILTLVAIPWFRPYLRF